MSTTNNNNNNNNKVVDTNSWLYRVGQKLGLKAHKSVDVIHDAVESVNDFCAEKAHVATTAVTRVTYQQYLDQRAEKQLARELNKAIKSTGIELSITPTE